MDRVLIVSPENYGKNFIPDEYLPEGKNEFYQRNKQVTAPINGWRNLKAFEIEALVKNDNTANDWDEVLVTDEFDPNQIKNTSFYGLVRIGRLRKVIIQHHDLQLPAGIYNSLIISCDIGDDVAIHNVHYLAHYIIGNRCILFNIQEMHTTNHAKFGNGILKEGEKESVRTWLEVMNETGCRSILPFDGMITADAYLWAKYVDDKPLQENLKIITQNCYDYRRGYYGQIGNQTVIKNSLILKDVKVGSNCYIKGANKLKNLTINSSEKEPSQIGEGVELVNGIIGYGCHIFYGCKAVKFILGNNSKLKYGARLIHSYLGDNSTISCCEVLNNLIFPSHEQHHNNSFLVASLVMGQSNMAAGATIGSNHNSRSNDNEIQAGRGFWPGLCTSLKHSSRFASFVLLSKADYPAELDIPLPFSLLNNNPSLDRLEVMPAYWWMHNMYALARNVSKYHSRDKRVSKMQHIEYDTFAPDTMEETLRAMTLLEKWTGKAVLLKENQPIQTIGDDTLIEVGKKALTKGVAFDFNVYGENMERGNRKALIIKPREAYIAYSDMLFYYGITNLLHFLEDCSEPSLAHLNSTLAEEKVSEWVNVGGQLMAQRDVDKLRYDIGAGHLKTWDEIHRRYDDLWAEYPLLKQKHAFSVLCSLMQIQAFDKTSWQLALDKALLLKQFVTEQVYLTRKKDYDNSFKQITFRNEEEMVAALGNVDENSFVIQTRRESEEFRLLIAKYKNIH